MVNKSNFKKLSTSYPQNEDKLCNLTQIKFRFNMRFFLDLEDMFTYNGT